MREIYDCRHQTEITQGTIINNCIAEDYPDEEVWGCIITPRCDLAHEGKVPTVHYVPIVRFSSWVRRVLKPCLEMEWRKSLKNEINQELIQCGAGQNLLDYFNKESILKIAGEKMKRNKLVDFSVKCASYFDGNEEEEKKYLTNVSKSKYILDRLIRYEIHAYYLIESWNKDCNDYMVLLLRDIRRMKFSTAVRFPGWFTAGSEKIEYFAENDLCRPSNSDTLYGVETRILSPYIEHIMQSFSHNFTRIGVADYDSDVRDALNQIIKTTLQ